MPKLHAFAVPITLAALAFAVPTSALAASSPTVVTGAATGIQSTAANLNGTVNPNGAATTYDFAYGPTPALGSVTKVSSAGNGTRAVSVKATVAGLVPGTTYYYRLDASNSAGASTGTVRSLKTSGNPPPQPTTGGAQNVSTYSATVTGVISPENQATTWYFQFGSTTNYGYNTVPQQVPAGTAAVPVSQTLGNLQPGTTFHYRLVATHGGSIIEAGADMTFETFPTPRPVPRISARTTPRLAKHRPFSFLTSGHLTGPSSTPASLQCNGAVKITYTLGRKTVGRLSAPVQPDCSFAGTLTFRHLPGHGPRNRTVKLTVHIRYLGNGYIAPVSARPQTVTLR